MCIRDRHDIEYGYIDELQGLKKEKELKKEYELSQKIVDDLKTEYENLYSEERKESIIQKRREIYDWIAQNDALLDSTQFLSETSDSKSSQTQEEDDENEEDQKRELEDRIETVVENEIEHLFPATHTLRRLVYDNVQVAGEYREEYLKPISEKNPRERLFQETITLGNYDYSLSAEPPVVVKFERL